MMYAILALIEGLFGWAGPMLGWCAILAYLIGGTSSAIFLSVQFVRCRMRHFPTSPWSAALIFGGLLAGAAILLEVYSQYVTRPLQGETHLYFAEMSWSIGLFLLAPLFWFIALGLWQFTRRNHKKAVPPIPKI